MRNGIKTLVREMTRVMARIDRCERADHPASAEEWREELKRLEDEFSRRLQQVSHR